MLNEQLNQFINTLLNKEEWDDAMKMEISGKAILEQIQKTAQIEGKKGWKFEEAILESFAKVLEKESEKGVLWKFDYLKNRVHSRAIDFLRREQRRRVEDLDVAGQFLTDNIKDFEMLASLIQTEMKKLSKDCQTIIIWRNNGFEFQEIYEFLATGKSRTTMDKRRDDCFAKLKIALSKDEDLKRFINILSKQ